MASAQWGWDVEARGSPVAWVWAVLSASSGALFEAAEHKEGWGRIFWGDRSAGRWFTPADRVRDASQMSAVTMRGWTGEPCGRWDRQDTPPLFSPPS